MTARAASGSLGAMNKLRSHGAAALVMAAALAVLAAVQATHGTFDGRLTSTVDYVNGVAFLTALLAFAFAVGGFSLTGAPAWAWRVAAVGPLLVAVGVAAGLATGESPSWFAVVAAPGNLMWLAATVGLAVWAWRSGAFPRVLAAGIGLTVPTVIALAAIGGGIVAAAVWAAIGVRWLTAAPGIAARPVPRPAAPGTRG